MNHVNKVALAGLQLAAVVGGFAHSTTSPANEITAAVDSQYAINQVSLQSIEESWLKVPSVCKAAAFNAQPVPLSIETLSADVQSVYSSFEV